MRKFYLMAVMTAAFFSLSAQRTATFEDVELPDSSFYNGSDGAGGFTSGGYWFPLNYNSEWNSWSGFSLSNMKDTITPGYQNQHSAIVGGGAGGSENYVTAYDAGELKLILEPAMEIKGFFITNSTYAYLAMRDGSDWTEKFGGSDGTDPDYFKLMVWGITPAGLPTDTAEFFLADFRHENPEDNFILNEWKWFDLTSLGVVTSLNFSLESSDVGEYGMNTPAYFCLDDFTGALPTFSSPAEKKQAQLIAYPNPIRDELFIDITEYSEQLLITDLSGKIYYKHDNPVPGKLRLTEVKQLQSGIYIINLRRGRDTFYQKVVKL